MSNTFDKLSVLDSFIEEVNSYLPEIEANLERLAQSPGDMDALEETHRRTHTIGGSASMMDFPGLAHVAHGMEDILSDALDGLTTLDDPTIDLLRRSLARLHQLLEGIRSGIDEEAVIAEDDADYARYRALADGSSQSAQHGDVAASSVNLSPMQPMAMPNHLSSLQSFETANPASSSMPSFDEVLASFRTPSVIPGEDVAWPEEPDPHFEESALRFAQAEIYTSTPTPEPTLSAWDTLVATAHQQISIPATPPLASYESYEAPAQTQLYHEDLETSNESEYPVQPDWKADEVEADTGSDGLPQAYHEMWQEAGKLEEQATSLKHMVTQLRSAMSVIEGQRGEFKGFLDGSKDALDRMEDWAGQAMGLNLRNSPEQVRRYLPLSVMWVANSKLKKVLDLLNQITGNAEVTDEQMSNVLQQLHHSIASFGDAFQQVQEKATHVLRPEPGWSSWQMQAERDVEAMRERVTFERQGDPASLRAEIEATLREEFDREYEARPISPAVRADLEQQIRYEVRQEFEASRRLQERVAGVENYGSLAEIEARLRNEIEIQVRQEFLSRITDAGEETRSAPQMPTTREKEISAPPPVSSNFVNQAHEATGYFTAAPPVPPSPLPRQPQPVVPSNPPLAASSSGTKSSSVSAFGGDFGEEAAEIFRLEAEEHLQTIGMHVAALEKAPTNRDLIQGMRRATHTLKGAAGMMGFRAIADLCHISEDLLDSIMEGTTAISSPVLSLILDTAETLDILITGRDTEAVSDEEKVQVLRQRYVELLGEQHASLAASDDDIDADVDEHVADHSFASSMIAGGQVPQTNAQRATRGDLSVRVRLQKLDELVNLFGELLVNRSVLEERVQRLVRLVADVGVSSNRLHDVGQRLESRFEAATLPSGRSVQVMPGEGKQSGVFSNNGSTNSQNGSAANGQSHLSDFDELELDRYTEFHQLARGLSEGISDMATLSAEMDSVIRECESVFARENRLSTTFQDRLMKVRLVPLSTMAPRLYRAARAVSLKQHKEFDFLLEGEATEVDRTVFEEIAGPLLHLMRNAVNHAIETPEVRIQKGKSPVGQIKLSAAYEGNQVVITVRDDGMGIDPDNVRNAAIARGLIRPDQVLSENDLIELIFRPGFSTAEVLSEESGRGVGLDVVRDSVSRLRGTLAVESMPGQGTAFTMTFPTSLAIQSAMMVRVGGQQFAIPTVMVETIGRLDNFKRASIAGQPAVMVHNDLYPLNLLAQYLSLNVGAIDDKAPLLLINTGGHRVALVVDEIKGKSDIVMKNLGPHLRHIHGIAGGTVLGNGRVVLVLELSELLTIRAGTNANTAAMSLYRENNAMSASQSPVRQRIDVSVSSGKQGASAMKATASASIPERGKHVLVVDDSPSVRRVVSNMLKQHGWEVQMARDGVEALEMIGIETPAAVLLDIEMPRMDGYELIATVRAQEQYRTLPLVVLTSRAAAKHQQRAMLLGASVYMIKPYQDEELINTLNSLVYGAMAR